LVVGCHWPNILQAVVPHGEAAIAFSGTAWDDFEAVQVYLTGGIEW